MPSALTGIDPMKLPTPQQRLGVMLALRAADEAAGRKFLPQLLTDPDPAIQFAAIEWVGEEHIKESRPRIVEILNNEVKTREMFEACVAALELIDGTQRPDEFHGEQYVVRVLTDAHASPSMQRLALRMLRPDHPALTIARLKSLLDSADESLRAEAIRSLRESPRAERIALLAKIASDSHNPSSLRAEAIVGLSDAEPQRELLLSLASGDEPTVRQEALRSLRGAALTDSQRSRLATLSEKDQATADLVAMVLKPPVQSNPPRHDVDLWLKALEGPGDPSAGERIFFHPRAAGCFRCHQIHGRGGHVGPDLSSDARLLGRLRQADRIDRRSEQGNRPAIHSLDARYQGRPFVDWAFGNRRPRRPGDVFGFGRKAVHAQSGQHRRASSLACFDHAGRFGRLVDDPRISRFGSLLDARRSQVDPREPLTKPPKRRGQSPFCSADCAKRGQSPAVL